ncbi:MAG TPA: helix-turn-helix domain-containing protein, partial [Pirellulales bacterium]
MNRLLAKVEWVRPPRQTRSQETLERLLDAAEEVFAEKGFESATVAEVVRRAKSSVGAMYARFTDKNALLSCLH